MQKFNLWIGDPRDPECPYDEDFDLEAYEDAYDRYVDDLIDQRMEERQ